MSLETEKPRPSRSSHLIHGVDRRVRPWHIAVAVSTWIIFTVIIYLLISNYRVFLLVGGTLTGVIAFVMAILMIISQTYTVRTSDAEVTELPAPSGPSQLSIGVIVPARHETGVLHDTVFTLAKTQYEHRSHKILVTINDDDPSTLAVAFATARVINEGTVRGDDWMKIQRHLTESIDDLKRIQFQVSTTELKRMQLAAGNSLVEVVVYPLTGSPNKPQQLNHVFFIYRESFDIFTVFDAESKAQEGLFVRVDQAIQDRPDVDIFQGGIQLIEPDLTGGQLNRFWISLRHWYAKPNALEYYRWFGSQMFYQADKQFMPLGGNTLFLRRDLLDQTDGWPPSLTEDCELGVRSTAIHQVKTLAFHHPELATREKTPSTLWGLIKQRRRWNIGFLQSFFAGNWRALPTFSQRFFAFRILTMSLFQAMTFALLPLTLITFFWIKSPAPLAVLLCIPVITLLLTLALEIMSLSDYGKAFKRPIRWYTCMFYALVYFPYQLVLSFAAAMAIWGYAFGRLEWDKTHHTEDEETTRNQEEAA